MKSEEKSPKINIKKIGIVGCGLMGSGFTQLCAQKEYQVVVSEVNDELLKKGLALINSRLTEGMSKGALSEQEKDAILSRIYGTTHLENFSDCDLVIEAATEKMEVKKKIFAQMDKICRKDIVLGTNTSVLSVLDIARVTSRPDKVLGIHMNPLVMPIAEIIKTLVTSDEAIEVAKNFSQTLGKRVLIIQDSPGFIANRLLMPLLLNAIRMIESGIAKKEDIDTEFTLGFGWPIGPLAMIDFAGLDTLLFISEALYDDLKEPQYAPPILLKKMVAANWLGCKTGKGFYNYEK